MLLPFIHNKTLLYMHPPILLASSSTYRAALLHKLGLDFIQVSPDIDESQQQNESAETLVKRLSEKKAQVLQSEYPQHIIIASDQIAISSTGDILGKPHQRARAIEQLMMLSSTKTTFLTGLTVLAPQNLHTQQAMQSIVDPFTVYFRKLSKAQITQYVDTELPLNCAGSFKSEGLGIALFERLEGDDPNTLIGLPLIKLCTLLLNIGVDVLLNQKSR